MDTRSVAFALLCTVLAVCAHPYDEGLLRAPGDYFEDRPGGLEREFARGPERESAGGYPGGYRDRGPLKDFQHPHLKAIPVEGREDCQVGTSTPEACREVPARHFAEVAYAPSEAGVCRNGTVVCGNRATLPRHVFPRTCAIKRARRIRATSAQGTWINSLSHLY
ncbi:hypothetical protein MTO96_001792 [Rhipicephalus appendiculatus]